MSDTEQTVAIRQQEKFEFYLVALVFTLLSLSIQTSSFTGPITARVFELTGWLSLLISGLSGLSYLEWLPVIRLHAVKKEELQENANQLKKQKEQGVQKVHILQDDSIKPIETRLKEYEEVIDKLKEKDPSLDKKSGIKYYLFKWCFLAGVLFIIASRSYEPLISIVKAICG